LHSEYKPKQYGNENIGEAVNVSVQTMVIIGRQTDKFKH
jgi:hypothetical protein